jgi:hypothetical protein
MRISLIDAVRGRPDRASAVAETDGQPEQIAFSYAGDLWTGWICRLPKNITACT